MDEFDQTTTRWVALTAAFVGLVAIAGAAYASYRSTGDLGVVRVVLGIIIFGVPIGLYITRHANKDREDPLE